MPRPEQAFLKHLAFALCALLALYLGVMQPLHNWDMIAYVAAAKSFEERDPVALHTFTYSQVRQHVSERKFEELTQIDYYRKTVSTDPTALYEQLPFYRIRPVYNALVYAFHKFGVDIAFATHLISALSVAAALIVLSLLAAALLPTPLAATVPVLAMIYGVPELSRLSTPDGLAFLLTTIVAHAFIYARYAIVFVTLILLVATRTDFILFALPVLFAIAARERRHRVGATVTAAICLAAYLLIQAYWANPGWAKIFYFAFVQILTHPLSTTTHLTPAQYFHALLTGLQSLLGNKAFLLYCIFVGHLLVIWRRHGASLLGRPGLEARMCVLAAVCTTFVALHFLAFPAMWDRFFAGAWLIGSFVTLVLSLRCQHARGERC